MRFNTYPKETAMIKVTAGTRLAIADVNVTEVKDMASKWKF
jgi:hypothetical protein